MTCLGIATPEYEEKTLWKGLNCYVVWEKRSVTSQMIGMDMVYGKKKNKIKNIKIKTRILAGL